MSDLIDRQAAIDCLGFTWPEDAIRNLPSAQPERIDWDTIAYLSDIRAGYDCNDEEERRYYRSCSKAIDALRHMPSALTAEQI